MCLVNFNKTEGEAVYKPPVSIVFEGPGSISDFSSAPSTEWT